MTVTRFRLIELFQAGFSLYMALLQIVFWGALPHAGVMFSVYLAIAALALAVGLLKHHLGFFLARWLYWFLPVPMVVGIYLTLGQTIPHLAPEWLDPSLAALDRLLFGVPPSVWLERWYTPSALDVCSAAYSIYYFFPVSLIIVLYAQGRLREFDHASTVLGTGFYFLYFCYIIFPVVGPHRYPEVAAQYTRDIAASGGAVTVWARAFVDSAELTIHDCFPSGHTGMTLLSILLARRWSRPLFWIMLLPGAVLIFSTVYLR
ncbi:MAG: phosphatase PAP2 family protein, partial [Planctomycetes bacterium]|nr:phosphatase PAP2 family protein [Planctomycetota bacterium]